MDRDQTNKFDDKIREGLSDLQPDYRPMSWDKLSERLPEASAQVAADEHVKQALDGLHPTYNPQSWEVLSEKINLQEAALVDDAIKTQLTELPTPVYQPGSWAKLAARLELIAQRRSCLAAIKTTELCLLFSLLLLFWNFFPYGGFGEKQALPVLADQGFYLPQNDITADNEITDNISDSDLPAAPIASFKTSTVTDGKQNRSSVANVNTPTTDVTSKNITQKISALPTVPYAVILPTRFNFARSVTAIPNLDFALNNSRISPQPALRLQPLPGQKGERSLRLFISPWDLNQVVTPAFSVRDKEVDRDNRTTYGFSAGVLVDNDHGKNGHSYGLVYGRRSYVPTVIADAEGLDRPTPSPFQPIDTNYSRIIFHTVSLPFNYQRELINNGRWRFMASAGVEANLVLKSKFYKSPNFDENIANYLRSSTVASLGRNPSGKNSNVLTTYDLTNPEPGLLQGGSALRNSSFYLTLGFSIERRLNESMSLFIAPQLTRAVYYRRHTGLGPFDDRIHHHAIRLGARYQLGE